MKALSWLMDVAVLPPAAAPLRLLALLVAVLLLFGVPELGPLVLRLCGSSLSSLPPLLSPDP